LLWTPALVSLGRDDGGERLSWKSRPKCLTVYAPVPFHWPILAPDGVDPRLRVSPSDCSGLGKWWSWPSLPRSSRSVCRRAWLRDDFQWPPNVADSKLQGRRMTRTMAASFLQNLMHRTASAL